MICCGQLWNPASMMEMSGPRCPVCTWGVVPSISMDSSSQDALSLLGSKPSYSSYSCEGHISFFKSVIKAQNTWANREDGLIQMGFLAQPNRDAPTFWIIFDQHYGLNCFPLKFICWCPHPQYLRMWLFADWVFKEVITLKWGPMEGP